MTKRNTTMTTKTKSRPGPKPRSGSHAKVSINLPSDLHRKLLDLSDANYRNLSQQMIKILEEAVR
jgi:hypothetical protein